MFQVCRSRFAASCLVAEQLRSFAVLQMAQDDNALCGLWPLSSYNRSELFGAEGHYWVDGGGAAGWDETG
jgi:hypothetical protein